MSRREVHDCDRCGLKDINPFQMSLCVGSRMDAAGSSENIYENIDLCDKCANDGFRLLLFKPTGMTREDAKWLAEKLKGAKS